MLEQIWRERKNKFSKNSIKDKKNIDGKKENVENLSKTSKTTATTTKIQVTIEITLSD